MCFVFIWEKTATCATYSINWLVFITELKSVYSAVRNGSLNKAVCAVYLKGWNSYDLLYVAGYKVMVCYQSYSVTFSLNIFLPAKNSPARFWVLEGRNINCSDKSELLYNPNKNLIFVDTGPSVFAFGVTQRYYRLRTFCRHGSTHDIYFLEFLARVKQQALS